MKKESKIRERERAFSSKALLFFDALWSSKRRPGSRSSCFPLFAGHLRSFPFPFVIVVWPRLKTHHTIFFFQPLFASFNFSPPLFVPGKSVNKQSGLLTKFPRRVLTKGSKQVSNDRINIKAILPRLFEILVRIKSKFGNLFNRRRI